MAGSLGKSRPKAAPVKTPASASKTSPRPKPLWGAAGEPSGAMSPPRTNSFGSVVGRPSHYLFGILARQLEPLERRDQAMPQIFDPNQAHLVAPILSHGHPLSA